MYAYLPSPLNMTPPYLIGLARKEKAKVVKCTTTLQPAKPRDLASDLDRLPLPSQASYLLEVRLSTLS